MSITSLAFSLAEALADVLCFVTKSSGRTQDQVARVKTTLSKLRKTLTGIKKRREEQIQRSANYGKNDIRELDAQLDVLCERLVLALAHLNPQSDLNLDEFVNINEDFLEEDSYLILKTAHLVLNALCDPEGFEVIKKENPFDFTPGVICLAKVFEREINFSVVHWIRDSLGIELPRYFYKFQPGLQKNRTRFGGANFNMVSQAEGQTPVWYPPETGKSLKALAAFKSPSERTKLNDKWTQLLNNDTFFDKWEVIRSERNIAAHNTLVGEKAANNVRCALNDLSQEGIFEILSSMKKYYRDG